MGLTKQSAGQGAIDRKLCIRRNSPRDRVIALAGNPNVGKSTVFNGLTGMKQHTGNWPGKTVATALGRCYSEKYDYHMVDLPGTYSLMAHSAEEEIARDFLCNGCPDAVIVVCDATCLERNLNLVLQVLELTPRVVVCLNLMDEARRKGIHVDIQGLSLQLGVPVVATVARQKQSLKELLHTLETVLAKAPSAPFRVTYPTAVESELARVEPTVRHCAPTAACSRWLALQWLAQNEDVPKSADLQQAVAVSQDHLREAGFSASLLKDTLAATLIHQAERISSATVAHTKTPYSARDRHIDHLLTSKWLGVPLMLALLFGVFWLTIVGSNYPSAWLSSLLFRLQDGLTFLFTTAQAPDWLHGAVVLGAYRVLAWVISVMLPPMAIFFPLFTLLEDVGYLPRVAYNLDPPLQRCHACGKQALTMCMGFGCNAAGVVGCRIIDSPRERLIAVLTNVFVPCNGRFPALITLLTLFFIGSGGSIGTSCLSAVLLTAIILLSILITFAITHLLSVTLLKGLPSSFTLELPPYRRPQIGQVVVRSLLDRTLFVLGRAAAVAAPAGLLLWVLANTTWHDSSLLQHGAAFLDPFAQLMGLDGAIMIAFILGFPANEIVMPIILMIYLAQGTLTGTVGLAEMKEILVANHWTWETAACTILFSLMHWPCSTTLLTIRKETGSWKWTAVAGLLPTALGIIACMLFHAIVSGIR